MRTGRRAVGRTAPIILLCLAAASADPAADAFSRGDYRAFLESAAAPAGKSDRRVWLMRVAVAVETQPEADREGWAARLASGGEAAELALYRKLLREPVAAFGALVELTGVGGMDWRRLAEVLRELVRRHPDQAVYEHASAGLKLLAALSLAGMSEWVTEALEELVWLDRPVRDGYAQALGRLAAREAAEPGRGWSVRAVRGQLYGRLTRDDLKDPFLAGLLVNLCPGSAQRLSLVREFIRHQQREIAVACLRGLQEQAPEGLDLQLQVALFMAEAGQPEETLARLRRLTAETGYPERRRVRFAYYHWLHRTCPRCPAGQSARPGVPNLTDELAAAEARVAADVDDDEAKLALADLLQVQQRTVKAAWLYATVLGGPGTAAARQTAWVGLAEAEPATAWDRLDQVELTLGQPTGWLSPARYLRAVWTVGMTGASPGDCATRLTALAERRGEALPADVAGALAASWVLAGEQGRADSLLAAQPLTDGDEATRARSAVLSGRLPWQFSDCSLFLDGRLLGLLQQRVAARPAGS